MGASTMLGELRARLERSASWVHVRTRFFMIKRLVLVCFLLALDARDLVYKAVWQGPAQTFSFETGSVSYLETKPIESLVTPEMRRHGDVSSGWPSFLSACDELYPFVSAGSTFFLSAKLTGCRVRSNGTSATIPPLVVTSSVRVDSMAWAACRLLYHARRPDLCGDRMVVNFNERYVFDEFTVAAAAMVPIGSFAETELLRLLDLIGGSYPIQSVICVEGFPLHSETDRGVFTPNVFACASPNVGRVEFVGFDAHSFKLLQGPMTWLTVDTLAFLNWRYGIRQNCASDYLIADATIADEGASVVDDETASSRRATVSIRAITATNFSSHGLLYGLVILLDALLLTSHLVSIAELLKWMQLAQYYRLQVWIRHFDDANEERVTSAPVLPGQLVLPEQKWQKKSKSASANDGDVPSGRFDERALYAFFSTSVYRGWRYRTMIVATRMLSWLIIMPNSVIWTWSESKNMKLQAYLGSIKSWVLVAATFMWSWHAFVRFNEPLAYFVACRTHITNQEIIALASVVAFWQRHFIFSICEQKWQLERQRTNDLTSFRGGYLAHGNAYEPRLEHTTTTPLRIAWIIYAPLMRIVVGSVLMIWVWLAVKLLASTLWRRAFGAKHDKAVMPEEPYRRLALELALESPIRALSIVRYQFSMEMVKNGERYIRPSCYLDYGIMLKTVEYKRIIHLSDIFKRKVPIPGGSRK